jgi:hypothetical protein
MVDWNEIKEEYVTGETSYRKLAAAHGVSHGTIGKIAAREGWTELKKRRGSDENGESAEALREEDLNGAADVGLIADKLLARLSALADGTALDTQGIKQIVSALKDLRELKEYPTDAELRRARIRKLEREAEACDNGLREVEIVFRAGSEDWNE